MGSENWTEERERLLGLLQDYESGKVTHFEGDDSGQLRRETTAERIVSLKHRIADLDARLGTNEDA